MNQKKYFKVSASWMRQAGRGEESQVFEVVSESVAAKGTGADYNIVNLRTALSNWPVLWIRGRFVAPYTIVISGGHFSPAAADIVERGDVVNLHVEYATIEEARIAADVLNKNLIVARAADVVKAQAATIVTGTFVRRLNSEGLPMAKTWRMGGFDADTGLYEIVDPLNPVRTIAIKPATYLAIDTDD